MIRITFGLNDNAMLTVDISGTYAHTVDQQDLESAEKLRKAETETGIGVAIG